MNTKPISEKESARWANGKGKINYVTLEMFGEKPLFLVDVFDTFLNPSDKGKPIRDGFKEFLAFYSLNKTIALHSDAVSVPDSATFPEFAKTMGIDSYISAFFGKQYLRKFDFDERERHEKLPWYVKDYERMAQELGFTLDDCVVIGDPRSELPSVRFSGVLYLKIPSFSLELRGVYPVFDFRNLTDAFIIK